MSLTKQQLREKKNQIIDSLNPIKIVGAVGSFPQFDKAKADLDHLIDEYTGQEHLLTAGDGTSLKCSCGKMFGSTDEANQHQQWHLELEARRRAGIGGDKNG